MDYRTITDTTSKQYKLIESGIFNTSSGLLITDDGYIAVALGSKFGGIGDKFRITLDNGTTFLAIKTDEKSDRHTINNCHHADDGSLVEFVVDVKNLKVENKLAYVMGDISYVEGFNGKVTSIELEV